MAHYQGEARGLEGQALRWVLPEQLVAEGLLPADRPIVAALMDRGRAAGAHAPSLADVAIASA